MFFIAKLSDRTLNKETTMENNATNTNAPGAENNTAAQQEKTFSQADVRRCPARKS